MSAPIILSAYRQLQPAERAFVDDCIARIGQIAASNHERISNALYRPLPDDLQRRGAHFLERAMVTAAITERISEIAAATELTHQRIIQELSTIAFSNLDDFLNVNNGYACDIDLSTATREQLASVAQYDFTLNDKGYSVKLKFHSKMDALKTLMQYTGMMEADNPMWRADTARPVNALPATATQRDASAAYAQMIGDK